MSSRDGYVNGYCSGLNHCVENEGTTLSGAMFQAQQQLTHNRQLNQKALYQNINEADIRATYQEGEDAVVELVIGLIARIEKLEERLGKDSRNSNKPPSGDGFQKRTKSLRGKSQRKSGGQIGHPGRTMEWSETVDAVVLHPVTECQGCGASLTEVAAIEYVTLPRKGGHSRRVDNLGECSDDTKTSQTIYSRRHTSQDASLRPCSLASRKDSNWSRHLRIRLFSQDQQYSILLRSGE